MITLGQLRAFAAVARFRHFTRAAESLAVAQPSVSYQVRELERSLGVSLVDVVGRRVFLTDAGELLAARAAGILNDLDNLERELRGYGTGERGRLRIGATRTVGGYALPETLGTFRKRFPGIELRVTIDNTLEIERRLLSRDVDLAVVEWRVSSPDLLSRPLRRDALVLVAPPDHPLAMRSTLTREVLRGASLVTREPGSGTRALAEQALGPILDTVEVVVESDQPEAILRMVEAGLGLAFISAVIAEREIARGALRALPIADVDLWRDFSLVTLRNRRPSAAMSEFAEHIAAEWAGR